MRTIHIVVLAAALALVAGANAGPRLTPSVRFVDLTPAKVHGTHFGARERVRVTLRAGSTKRVRTTRASARGAFAVNFGTLPEQDRCSGSVAVAALGLRGHRALYKLPSMACPVMTSDRYDR
jgi:hypothetical protein